MQKQVWDFCGLASLRAALEAREGMSELGLSSSGLALALKAAVNCSSASRHSPLHAAVERDCKASLEVRRFSECSASAWQNFCIKHLTAHAMAEAILAKSCSLKAL